MFSLLLKDLIFDFYSDYLDFIYQSELEIKDTAESTKSTSLLGCLLEMDNSGKLSTKLYDKALA